MTEMWWRSELRFTVIKIATTGFSESDRIVEIACLTIVGDEIVDEYDTLIQADRDPGPVHVHNITPMMLEAAPTYDSVAADIADRLDGAVLVGHNLNFDLRMLSQEMARIDGAVFDAGIGVCTYVITGHKLAVAAHIAGLSQPNHTALQDARTMVELMRYHSRSIPTSNLKPARCEVPRAATGVAAHRSETPGQRGSLHEIAAHTDWAELDQKSKLLDRNEAAYLDALDACLDDGELDFQERQWLDIAAKSLGLSNARRHQLHSRYYELIIDQIKEDEIITDEERDLSAMVADALLLEDSIASLTEQDTKATDLQPGTTVCFDGTASLGGKRLSPVKLKSFTTKMGLAVVPSISEKGCDLLVAADVNGKSTEVSKARERNVPVISIEEFLGGAFSE